MGVLHFPLQNIRQDIETNWLQNNTTETIIVPSGAPYITSFIEVPDDGTVNNKPSVPGLSETTTYPPSAGYYYINYNNGKIAFNSNEAGNSYNVDYWQKGSLVEVEDINHLYNRIQEIDSEHIIDSSSPSSPYHGQQWYDTSTGITYSYDIRDKWLSLNRPIFAFGRKGRTNNQYLNYYGGILPSNNSGLRMVRDACIISLSAQINNINTCTFYIRKNGSATNITTININTDYGNQLDNININMNQGDILQCYFDSAFSNVYHPMINVEIAWRA